MPNKYKLTAERSPKIKKKAKNKLDKANIIPKPPENFNGYSKAKWEELAPIFVEKNMMSPADLSAFELLCRHYGDAMNLYDAIIEKDGSFANYFSGRNSQTMGEYLAYHKAISSYTKMLIEFGLTPASKKKVPTQEIIIEDTISKMLSE